MNKGCKLTLVVAFAAVMIFSASVYADDIVVNLKPQDSPTLDYFKENNILIPHKGAFDKTWVEAEPVISPRSAYTLTKVEQKSDNTITRYEWDKAAQSLVPQYYRVDLKKTVYGEGENVKYYEWSKGADGISTMVEVSAPSEGKTTIEYRYSTNKYAQVYDNKAELEDLDNTKFTPAPIKIKEDETVSIVDTLFVNNKYYDASQSVDIYGGALYNAGNVENIVADFIGNNVSTSGRYSNAYGAAIYNSGKIGDITGVFIGNSSISTSGGYARARGGAIYNAGGTIGDITSDFIGNSVSALNPSPDFGGAGGAIYNENGSIGNITGNFIGNISSLDGGGIYNNGIVANITGDFIGNLSSSSGGAIHNGGTIGDITSDFIKNNTVSGFHGYGGAIHNHGTIGDITGNFTNNSISSNGYLSSVHGGAIHNAGTIGDITSDFISNTVSGSYKVAGGAISNDSASLGNITGNFIGNSCSSEERAFGGAIYNTYDSRESFIGDITGNFINNSTSGSRMAYGGAISNFANIGQKDDNGNIVGGIVNSSFIGNHVDVSRIEDNSLDYFRGGAIYTSEDLNIISRDNYTSIFKDNYINQGSSIDDNAIYIDDYNHTLNFQLEHGGKVYMADNIRGNVYNVNITGDNINDTVFYMLNDMYGANLTTSNTTLNTINNAIHTYNFNTFALTSNTNLHVDVDLANQTMDRLTAKEYGVHTGTLNVSAMHLTSDATSDHTEILFADPGLKDNVSTTVTEVAYTPIHKYSVNYSNQDDGGYFHFDRAGACSNNPSDSFNPSVLSTPVAAQAGAQSVVNETVHFAFQHMDMFSQLPFAQRIAIINNNKYAINDPTLTPKYGSEFEMINKGFWTKPFTSFERINLHHGPDVDAITYGTLVGFDSNFRELKRGWYNVQSIYGGYNGSQLSYSGVDSTLNGGVAGITETFYKNNFFTAVTATAGASVGTNNTMYGNEDFTVLLGGIGAKGGYNFEFKDGKYILQPIMFANYSFVNTFDYTNAAGVRMKSDPLHTFQINPQLKFVANLSNGWQPYASVGFVWNVLNSSKVKADDVILPKMTVDPYVEYGLGLQRNWKERFTGFAQAMVRNGGRNGVALTFGFRWAIGKGGEDL